jgi:hypothetical protein
MEAFMLISLKERRDAWDKNEPTWFLTQCYPKSSFLLVRTTEKLF